MTALSNVHATPADPVAGERNATRVGRNTMYRLAAQVVSALINVAGMVLLGNYLSAGGYGEYVFYYALVPLVASACDLGAGVIITRNIARDPADGARTMGDGLLVKAAVGTVILTLVSVSAWRFLGHAQAVLLILVAAGAIMDFSQDAAVWVFRAHERLDLEALLLLISQVAWLAGIGFGVAMRGSLTFMLGSATIAFLLRTLAGLFIVSRSIERPRFAPQMSRLKLLVAEGWPIGLAMLGVVLYGRSGVLMLKGLSTASEVACFNVAYMLSQPLGFIASALSVAAFPAFARFARENTGAIREALRRTLKYQLLATLPLTAGLLLLSSRIVRLLFHGADFERAGLGLRVIAFGLPFIFLNLQSRYVLAAMDRQRVYLWAVVAGLIVNVALCLVLVHPLGVVGAAWAFIAAEFAIFVICQSALSIHVGVVDLLREAARPALAAAAMALLVFAIRGQSLPLVITAGGVAYVGALLVTRALSRDELNLIRGVYVSFGLPGSQHLARAAERS